MHPTMQAMPTTCTADRLSPQKATPLSAVISVDSEMSTVEYDHEPSDTARSVNSISSPTIRPNAAPIASVNADAWPKPPQRSSTRPDSSAVTALNRWMSALHSPSRRA